MIGPKFTEKWTGVPKVINGHPSYHFFRVRNGWADDYHNEKIDYSVSSHVDPSDMLHSAKYSVSSGVRAKKQISVRSFKGSQERPKAPVLILKKLKPFKKIEWLEYLKRRDQFYRTYLTVMAMTTLTASKRESRSILRHQKRLQRQFDVLYSKWQKEETLRAYARDLYEKRILRSNMESVIRYKQRQQNFEKRLRVYNLRQSRGFLVRKVIKGARFDQQNPFFSSLIKPRSGARLSCGGYMYSSLVNPYTGQSESEFIGSGACSPSSRYSTVINGGQSTCVVLQDAVRRAVDLSPLILKHQGKILDSKVNLANMLAESDQTLSLLATSVKKIAQILTGAAKFKNVLLQGLKPKNMSDEFLAYQFGVKPLIQDVDGLLKTLAEVNHGVNTMNIRKRSTQTISVSNEKFGLYRLTGVVRVSLVSLHKVESEELRLANQLGYTNPDDSVGGILQRETLWEVTPWSFVVDWFIPVSDYLRTLSYDNYAKVDRVSVTYTFVGSMSSCIEESTFDDFDQLFPGLVSGTSMDMPHWTGTIDVRLKFRDILNDIPMPSLVLKNPFSVLHGFEAIALLTQRLRK